MKALLYREHGETDVLQYEETAEPQVGPGEVMVKLEAAALNHLDIWIRRGWPGLDLAMPHIGGADGAGVVAALGAGVGDGTGSVAVGARVAICPGFATRVDEFTRRGEPSLSPSFHILGEQRSGTFAEYVAVPEEAILPMPDEADFNVTAAAQLTFLTAWRMLLTQGRLMPGETVLIVGAGGGVNSAALQIAKLCGATVIALTSTDEKMEQAVALGADHLINYTTSANWGKEIRALTDGRGVDIVVDNVGKATFGDSMKVARRGGRLLTVGNTSGPKVEIDIRFIFSKQLHIIGSTMGSPQEFRDVMKFVWSGAIEPVIDTVAALADGAAAQERLQRGDQFGKIVLTP
jgi:NADPH2:quinone reductase